MNKLLNTFDKFDGMIKFSRKTWSAEAHQKEKDNLNCPIFIKENKFTVSNLPAKEKFRPR